MLQKHSGKSVTLLDKAIHEGLSLPAYGSSVYYIVMCIWLPQALWSVLASQIILVLYRWMSSHIDIDAVNRSTSIDRAKPRTTDRTKFNISHMPRCTGSPLIWGWSLGMSHCMCHSSLEVIFYEHLRLIRKTSDPLKLVARL